MLRRSMLFFICMASFLFGPALADEFATIDHPKFKEIQPRLVYGKIIYDFAFKGGGPKAKKGSAEDFLKSAIKSKFSNKSGSYIVTLGVSLNEKTIASEPILAATWKSEKFLFITTSEKSDLVINNDGKIVDDLVIDNDNNALKFTISILRSDSSSFDLSLFKQISDLSKNSFISKLSPGLAVASEIYAPFEALFTKLLSKFEEQKLVEASTGSFTLLDEEFGNQLRYSNNKFALNIFLKTENSQLNGSFESGKFKIADYELVLATVKSGVGATRATVLDIISAGGGSIEKDLTEFVRVVKTGKPFGTGYQTQSIAASCKALKSELNTHLLTTRDASLAYWAFLQYFAEELRKYSDAVKCASEDIVNSLGALGLSFDPNKLKSN